MRALSKENSIANIFDVAKYILRSKGPMSVWKLQKLCYYAQAWSIAWTEKPLFEGDFEARGNGPVCRELLCEHQGEFSIGEEALQKGDPENLNPDQREIVDIVIRDYGNMEPHELVEMARREDPWISARDGIPDTTDCNPVISKEAMGEYYGSL